MEPSRSCTSSSCSACTLRTMQIVRNVGTMCSAQLTLQWAQHMSRITTYALYKVKVRLNTNLKLKLQLKLN
jgi:hypothetical protein